MLILFLFLNCVTVLQLMTSNEGNFRLIYLYRSIQIQNEIISSCGNIILQTIVKIVIDS